MTARHLAALLLPALLRAVPAVAVMLVLWDRFETFAPDSADIGGGPIGLLVPSAAGLLVAAVDGWRLGRRAAVLLWVGVCATVALLLAAAAVVTGHGRPGSVGDAAVLVVLVVVAAAFFGLLPLLGLTLGAARHPPRRP